MQLEIEWNGKKVPARLRDRGNGQYELVVGADVRTVDVKAFGRGQFHIILDGKSYDVQATAGAKEVILSRPGGNLSLKTPDDRKWSGAAGGAAGSDGSICAPMPGKVVKYQVKVGDEVKAGQGIVIVEAMKMQNELKSPVAGKIVKLGPAAGTAVEAGTLLLQIEPAAAPTA